MSKVFLRKFIIIISTLGLMASASMAEARGGYGVGGYHGNVGGFDGRHGYDNNINVNRDVNASDNYHPGGYYWNGRHYNYYNNGQYYNYYSDGNYYRYYYNGQYYNNCTAVAGFYQDGIWIPPSMSCY